MAAVAGFLLAAAVAIAFAWLAVGRHQVVTRAPGVDVAQIGARHVPILGGLAGFAVTAMILLVTQGRNFSDVSGTPYTTLLTMYFVAYLGFLATSLLFANITEADPAASSFDVAGAMFAGAEILQFFTVAVGWFALVPLFDTFGLSRLAGLAGWLLTVGTIASYGLVATQLHRSGYVGMRLSVVIPLAAVVVTLAYAVIAAVAGLRTPDAMLDLTVTAFVFGAPAFGLLTALPVLVRNERSGAALARLGAFLVVAFAQGSIVFVGFLLLTVLRLA